MSISTVLTRNDSRWAITRRILLSLALLMLLFTFGVEGWIWRGSRDEAFARAREDASAIGAEAKRSQEAAGSNSPAVTYYRDAARVSADEAADNRVSDAGCDWRRDTPLISTFDASGEPVRKPNDRSAITHPGSSVPGVRQSALSPWNEQSGPWPGVSFRVRAKDAPCLVDGTAVGVIVPFDGGAVAVMHVVAFDWVGYRELLIYAYGALLIFWLFAELGSGSVICSRLAVVP